LLALKNGQTIIENEFLGLGDSLLGGSLVVETRSGGSVDGGVEEDGCVLLVTAARDVSKTEALRGRSERRVSLAGRRSRL
jgi:hypothetical protein